MIQILNQRVQRRGRGRVAGADGVDDGLGRDGDVVLKLVGDGPGHEVVGQVEEVRLGQDLAQGLQFLFGQVGGVEVEGDFAAHEAARSFKVDAHTTSPGAELQSEESQDGVQASAASRPADGDPDFRPAFFHRGLFETVDAE